MQYNFFQWLREGVRQAVLLGVSDAVEQIGPPHDAAESQERLQRTLGVTVQNDHVGKIGVASTFVARKPAAATSRRLGKSLKDLGQANG